MLAGQKLLDGHPAESRVAQMAIAVRGREAEEPAEQPRIGAEVVARPELLQCGQRLQEHEALAVRRRGEDSHPSTRSAIGSQTSVRWARRSSMPMVEPSSLRHVTSSSPTSPSYSAAAPPSAIRANERASAG